MHTDLWVRKITAQLALPKAHLNYLNSCHPIAPVSWTAILLWHWCKQTPVKLQGLQLFIIYVTWSLLFFEALIFRLLLHPHGACKAKGEGNNLTESGHFSDSKGQTRDRLHSFPWLSWRNRFVILVLKAQLGQKNTPCSTTTINIIFCFLRLMNNEKSERILPSTL